MFFVVALPHSHNDREERMHNLMAAPAHAVVLSIGGMPIRLLSDDSSFLDTLEDRYRGFLSFNGDGAANLLVNVGPRKDSPQKELRVARTSGLWSAERVDFRLDWDFASKSGSIWQERNAYSLDAALRILHTLLLAEKGGFLLHAASGIRDGRAFLFFGPSGAGKTTVARAAPSDTTLLTDE